MDTLDRIPQDKGAEEAVVASCLYDDEALPRVIQDGGLDRADFSLPRCADLWAACVALYARGEPVNQVTALAEIATKHPKQADELARYIAGIVADLPTSSPAHLAGYVRAVRDKARRRRLVSLGARVTREAHEDVPVERIVADAQTTLSGLDHDQGGFRDLAAILADPAFDAWEDDPAETHATLSTGIAEVDRVTGGLRRREQTILAARTGEGKTICAMTLSVNAARAGHGVAFVSLEMDTLSLGKRVVCALAGLDPMAIRARKWWPGELERYREARRRAAALGVHIDDTTGLTTPIVRGRVQRLQEEHRDLALLVVDYAGLVMDDEGRDEAETRRLGKISVALRSIGRELDLAVLTVAQLNRKTLDRAGGRPTLADIRDSDKLAQDSGAVWLLYQPLDGEGHRVPDRLTLYVAKNRYGPQDTDIDLRFDRRLGRITAWQEER